MTMYLPNPDIQPTGAEAAEFIDVPPLAERPETTPTDSDTSDASADGETPVAPSATLRAWRGGDGA
jgi:hypothetical protein